MKMKNIKRTKLSISMFLGAMLAICSSCSWDPSDDVRPATFSDNAEVFIDGFSGGLEYLPFAGSKLNAFTVDNEEVYAGEASMRFDVPNVGDPDGAFAGAIFPDNGGRDLSGYDALTFWARASKAATINEIGFGQDFGENKHLVSAVGLRVTTAWTKYVIPIPDPSKLTMEKGLFWYSEGPENGDGYSFWIDELKFEKLGTIAQPRPSINFGLEEVVQSFIGSQVSIIGLIQTFNLADGTNQSSFVAPGYFTFTSSDPSVATVNEKGEVSILSSGTTTITAQLGNVKARGSVTIESLGAFVPAPTPTRPAADVVSIFSDAYTNAPVDFFNGFFIPDGQTTLGGADLNINGDNIIRYSALNFVAIEFKNPTVDASEMTHLHVDIQIQEAIEPGDFLSIELGDFGPDGTFGGGDNSSSRLTYTSDQLAANQWISLDIPLADFSGLTSRANMAQIFFVSDATISNLLVDNIYFYK